jgi:hypothetical protein
MIAAAAEMSPAVRRASAILVVARLAWEFQERIAPAAVLTGPEAQAALVERQELEQSDLPTHPNQVRTDEQKGADMRQEKHKAVVGSRFRRRELPRCNRSRTSLRTRLWQSKY